MCPPFMKRESVIQSHHYRLRFFLIFDRDIPVIKNPLIDANAQDDSKNCDKKAVELGGYF